MGSKKQIHFAAFIFSGTATQAWRHPDFHAHDSLDVSYWIEYAQLAEKAKFDTLFLADFAAFKAMELEKHFCSVSVFEPVTLMSALAVHTKHVGLLYTASVNDNEPTKVARQLASLDHTSKGRAGWNVVTTPGPGLANLGIPKEDATDSARKYKRARAFLEATQTLWDSFEDGAVVRDKKSGIFVDLKKVHLPKIDNEYFKINEALRIERPVQGYPVIAQAGTSPDGMAFGGAISDIIYAAAYSIKDGQETYRKLKTHATAAGRRPEDLVILMGVAPVWGETMEEAERKLREVSDLWPIEVAVENLSIDFGDAKLDDPFPETYKIGTGLGSSGRAAAIASFARSNNLTIRQTAERCSISLGHRPLVGTTQSICDDLQAWIEAEACDGFAVIQPRLIDGLRDFAEHIVPELQRRGVYHTEYEGTTLREHLGLRRPENRYTLAQKKAQGEGQQN
ncbi:N-acetyl-S-(2-succino)cysteine monooxygenase [Exophiala dermatitidis]